jgi:uncharacterized protein (DUF2235 family)
MPKTIAIFTDGTGNSARSLFKTNVWRLYQALDLAPLTQQQVAEGITRQISYYQDGVGTSSFKLLAVIGGAFGWGLKRNIVDAYIYLCRNYQPGDGIFLFGFSRGAFTARVFLGLILHQGLLTCEGEAELHRYARDAYRVYRREFNQTGGLVEFFRGLRDIAIRGWRGTWHKRPPLYALISRGNERPTVKFIGVWDTVSAYGLPIAELTRGIDDWIWPLSMPNYLLPAGVVRARHALSLDDEREAFHPLLWNELDSEEPDRIVQVWFPGVHADVGGGYPNDALAHISLIWMMHEAEAAGLRFKTEAIAEAANSLSASAPMHDSRQFLGAYYRYQPRRISAMVEPPDQGTLAMRDPELGGLGLLQQVKIHQSVFDRIKSGPDRYAPIVLPDQYTVIGASPAEQQAPEVRPNIHIGNQEKIWNWVWLKRVVYFVTVASTVTLLAYPLLRHFDTTCEGPQCLLIPIILGVGSLLPAVLQPWARGFAQSPEILVIFLIWLTILVVLSGHLQHQIHDRMRVLWDQALAPGPADQAAAALGHALAAAAPNPANLVEQSAGAAALPPADNGSDPVQQPQAVLPPADPAAPADQPAGSAAPPPAPDPGKLIPLWSWWRDRLTPTSLRRSRLYQGSFQKLRWKFLPGLFGISLLVGGVFAVGAVLTIGYYRFDLASKESAGELCPKDITSQPLQGLLEVPGEFTTRSLCWPTGVAVEKGGRYRVFLDVTHRWVENGKIYTSPTGFDSGELGWYGISEIALRRSVNGRWFQPIVIIIAKPNAETQVLEMRNIGGSTFVGAFIAGRTGPLFLSVNEAMISSYGWTDEFYKNDRGSAKVTIERY